MERTYLQMLSIIRHPRKSFDPCDVRRTELETDSNSEYIVTLSVPIEGNLINIEQAEINVKTGLYVHIINFVTSYQLLTKMFLYGLK